MKETTCKAIGSIAKSASNCVASLATAYVIIRLFVGPIVERSVTKKDGTSKTIIF